MRSEFHPDALAEYEEAARFYQQREPGLERRFIRAIEQTIQLILEDPTRWRLVEEDVRRCLARLFPYGILYTIETDYILIVAVMHCSREPDYRKQRIEGAL